MTELEKEAYLKIFYELTDSIEKLIDARDTISEILLEHDPECIHHEDLNLPSKFRLR